MLGIPEDIKLLPALFQADGYATASIGKWHNAKVIKKPKIAEDKQTRDYHDNMISTPEPGFAPMKGVLIMPTVIMPLAQRCGIHQRFGVMGKMSLLLAT